MVGSTALAAVLLSSCTGEPAEAETPATSSSTAAAGSAAIPGLPDGWTAVVGEGVPEVADPGSQELPVTVTSDDGVEVEVTDTSRTIAGGDDTIEVFDALGLSGQIMAAPEDSATETGQGAAETFLFNRSTGTEGVLSLDGTLFVGNSLRRHSELSVELRDAGTSAVIIDNLQPAVDKIRKVSQTVGMPAAGEELATAVQAQLDEAAEVAATIGTAPRVLHVSATGAGGAPAVGGIDSAAETVIQNAGGINVGTEAGVENYSELSPEGVVSTVPDIILLSVNDLEVFGGEAGLFEKYPTLAQTPAAENGAIFVMPDLQLKANGIASGAGTLALAQAFAALES